MTVLTDALGRRVPCVPLPRRVVSLVPSVTECLFDLGIAGRVVGRTDYCISPSEVSTVPGVGGPRSVDVAAVVGLEPDLVLANREENELETVKALEDLGIRVHVAFPRTLPEVVRYLRDLGFLLECPIPAEKAAEALERLPSPPRPSIPVACLVWHDPYRAAGPDTLTSALLAAAGAENRVIGGEGRYPAITPEQLLKAGVKVVLLPSEPHPFTPQEGASLEVEAPGVRTLPVTGEWVTWYGCRVPRAVASLKRALAPLRDPGGDGAHRKP